LGVYDFFKQVACFFFLGDNLLISEFCRLKNDVGYAKIIETCIEKMGSADTVSRMFDKFNQGEVLKFRDIFEIIFEVMIQKHTGHFISLTLDSMVLDNNDSKKKQGDTPTYKNVLNFQPLHLILDGMIVDMSFRGGNTHGNSENTALNMIVKAIRTIRKVKGDSCQIIFNMDSGFMDQEIFKAIENNKAFFVCNNKKYNNIKDIVKSGKIGD